ncbi:PHD finger protein 14-like isoform X2 [Artemia franciscana]
MVCSICLSGQANTENEVIECDGCGILVHEGCYGVSDTESFDSFCSATSMEPWFCEACKAGVKNPHCELCPSQDGVFKQTVTGRWVHLVCSLYTPGMSFGDVDSLSKVSIFDMPYNRFGSRICSLCEDSRLAGTGICIECDAGMCKTFFHVTCAQREGLLSEAHVAEKEEADPFYAHCKLHTDRSVMRRRKTAYVTLLSRMKYWCERQSEIKASIEEGTAPEHVKKNYLRVQKKIKEYAERSKLDNSHTGWYPAEKVQRLVTSSAEAVKSLTKKAELMGLDLKRMEEIEAQEDNLNEISKRWNVNPAFSIEYVGYFLDREKRIETLKSQNGELLTQSDHLQKQETELQEKINEITGKQKCLKSNEESLRNSAAALLNFLKKLLPDSEKKFVMPSRLDAKNYFSKKGPESLVDNFRKLTSPNGIQPGRIKQCKVCSSGSDAHLMAQCDECLWYYHISCLNPPLTRLPKKSKMFGWRCSACDRISPSRLSPSRFVQDSDTEAGNVAPSRPKRRSAVVVPTEEPIKKKGKKL